MRTTIGDLLIKNSTRIDPSIARTCGAAKESPSSAAPRTNLDLHPRLALRLTLGI
jgi:hypothetical protein